MNKPYIGITGPVTEPEVKLMVKEFGQAGYSLASPHIPMIGYLVSYKTLNGQPTENRRYTKVEDLHKLFDAAEGKVLTMVHYNTKETSTLASQIGKIFTLPYIWNKCRALQLNVIWPPLDQVRLIKYIFPELQIVFQASHKATKDKTPAQIASGIKAYGDAISYVLIDPSAGRGLEFNLEKSAQLYQELKEHCPDLIIGFAGGFTGENVESRLTDLVLMTQAEDFCIDAEGGLRDKLTSAYGDDLLNPTKVRNYLQNASKALK